MKVKRVKFDADYDAGNAEKKTKRRVKSLVSHKLTQLQIS
jgi:hypothetical protein